MECIFLFLDWLSSFAHINVRDGNEMDFTAISKSELDAQLRRAARRSILFGVLTYVLSLTVMAPTLLRPLHRDPRVNEVPAMIAVVLNLLEDQHILHGTPSVPFCVCSSF